MARTQSFRKVIGAAMLGITALAGLAKPAQAQPLELAVAEAGYTAPAPEALSVLGDWAPNYVRCEGRHSDQAQSTNAGDNGQSWGEIVKLHMSPDSCGTLPGGYRLEGFCMSEGRPNDTDPSRRLPRNLEFQVTNPGFAKQSSFESIHFSRYDPPLTDAVPDALHPHVLRVDISKNPAARNAGANDPQISVNNIYKSGESRFNCEPSGTVVCLNEGRFRVETTWTDPRGNSGPGQMVQLTDDSAYSWHSDRENIEQTVKVLNGRPINDHFWVFSGGQTNVRVDYTVTDTLAGQTRHYTNPQGALFETTADTGAFSGNTPWNFPSVQNPASRFPGPNYPLDGTVTPDLASVGLPKNSADKKPLSPDASHHYDLLDAMFGPAFPQLGHAQVTFAPFSCNDPDYRDFRVCDEQDISRNTYLASTYIVEPANRGQPGEVWGQGKAIGWDQRDSNGVRMSTCSVVVDFGQSGEGAMYRVDELTAGTGNSLDVKFGVFPYDRGTGRFATSIDTESQGRQGYEINCAPGGAGVRKNIPLNDLVGIAEGRSSAYAPHKEFPRGHFTGRIIE